MKALVVAESNAQGLRPASLSAMSFARSVAEQTGGDASWLVVGSDKDELAAEAAGFAPVLVAEAPLPARPVASPCAKVIADVVRERGFDLLVAASSSIAKDMVTRAAGLLGGAMASEVVACKIDGGQLVVDCPRFAGAVTTTLRLIGTPQIITVRPSAFPPAEPAGEPHPVESFRVDASQLDDRVKIEQVESRTSARPDVTEANIVVSGGRAIENSDDFERLVGGLADALDAATGSSRALVDAGIAPNEFQVGQTGKIVAPEWYIALGISGAVQHLAGMKNSRNIVAINTDSDAPMFEVADYGLVGDIYEVVPNLIEKLNCHATSAAG
ncbi:MAG: electron transfer flavoprotein subunit alpha/FixB family protein [Aeoliella sp.]